MGGVGSRASPAGLDWLNERFAKQLMPSARAVLPARLLEEYMHYLKCLFAVWTLASRAFAPDQAVK